MINEFLKFQVKTLSIGYIFHFYIDSTFMEQGKWLKVYSNIHVTHVSIKHREIFKNALNFHLSRQEQNDNFRFGTFFIAFPKSQNYIVR